MPTTYVIGDIHGHIDIFRRLLREAGLVDASMSWAGRTSALWLIGDFVDHGPDGVAAVALAMRLQREAAAAGGQVGALLGNHDALLLAVQRVGAERTGKGTTFREEWLENGGVEADLERLSREQAAWLIGLPPLALVGEHLLVHADARIYLDYGETIPMVGAAFQVMMRGNDPHAWWRLLDEFGQHSAFYRPDGAQLARAMLARFGGRQLIHGHTPIGKLTKAPDVEVREALVYAGGLCVDVDGGLVRGGPGFVYQL